MSKKILTIIIGLLLVNSVIAKLSIHDVVSDTIDIEDSYDIITLTNYYFAIQEYEKAKVLIDYALEFAPKVNKKYLLAYQKYALADYYYYTERHSIALEHYKAALPFVEGISDTLMILNTKNSIGLCYFSMQDFENALLEYLNTIDFFENIKTRSSDYISVLITIQTNIINIYSHNGDYKDIINTGLTSIELAESINDIERKSTLLNALGIAYKKLNQIPEAIDVYKEAIKLFKLQNDNFRISFVENNLAALYFDHFNDIDSSLYYYQSALMGFEKSDFKQGIANAKLGLASVFAYENKYIEAKKHYTEAINICTEYSFNTLLSTACNELSELEFNHKNYKRAFELKRKYSDLSDSIYLKEKESQLSELLTKYESSQKENRINVLKAEKYKHELKIKKNHVQKNVGFSVIILLLIFLYIAFIFYSQKTKANKQLKSYNQEIESKNEQLIDLNSQMNKMNKTLQRSKRELSIANNAKNRFFSILAHDLRNPFHNILGQSYLLSKQYKKLKSEDRIQFANEIYDSCDHVNKLLENLLEWSRAQSKGTTFQPIEIKYNDILQNAIQVLKHNANSKGIKIINNSDLKLNITADPSMLETVLRNLISNSIKFTPNGGTITLYATISQNKLIASIVDTGVGIEKIDSKKIFRIDSKLKTKGTNDEKGTGLGLSICKEFINFHKGKIKVESEIGKGSTFSFSIPLKH